MPGDETDALYTLPSDEFVAARDALAKRLRADKRREEAAAVKALRRPSIAAWAVNQAVRSDSAALRELLDAGAVLRTAHEALMAGSGGPDDVRAASERERDAVRALARAAAAALGPAATQATTEKVRETLHAAAADEALRERLEQGRLEREASGGVAGWPAVAEVAAPAPRKPAAKPAAKQRAPAAKRPDRAAERREEASRRAREAAEQAQDAAEQAERAAARAAEALEAAEQASSSARERLEAADADERAARRTAKEAEAEAERRRTEARRAVKAAGRAG